MPQQKATTTPGNEASVKKPRKVTEKAQVTTVMPKELKIQVLERKSPPDNHPICNGTSVEIYRPKTWGR